MEVEEAFDEVANVDTVTMVAAIGGGYLASSLAQSTLEGAMPFDVPNEAYGVLVAVAAYGPAQGTVPEAQAMGHGGMLYAIDSLAQRVGIKQSVTSIGGN